MEACREIVAKRGNKGIKPGEAVLTTAGQLPARFVIHTAGPIWKGGSKREGKVLADCYQNSLLLAHEHCLSSVAFPNISTGVYGYPKEEAAEIAIGMVRYCLQEAQCTNVKEVRFVCFDDENFQLYRQRMRGEAISL
ncbi:macro domain-containing protein [Cesiribacter andamanensis]|uniref:macro domain-containing protein n=1 Tax=Cesiribacter andamanensis TaxID=649507 RepID=UPI00373FDBA7